MPQNIYPMIVMRGVVLFPKMTLRFDVARPKSVEALKFAAENGQEVFLAAQKDVDVQNPKKDDVFTIGCVATVKQIVRQSDSFNVLVEGITRAKIENFITTKPFFSVEVSPIEDAEPIRETKANEALMHTAQRLFTEFCSLNGNTSHEIIASVMSQTRPGALADYLAANTLFNYDQQQTLLSELSPVPRLKKLVNMLAHLNSVLELENEIEDKVRVSMDKNQRDYYLKEQMRTISEELGEESEMDEFLEYQDRIRELNLEPEIAEKLEKEAAKLLKMPPGAVESSIIRNYLDTCLELPWNKSVTKKHTIAEMRRILDSDHFGLQKVKDRILEHLAVGILAPEIKGQVLCLVGPPGVGKSSVARSIARASGRNFGVISLGGVRDEADIRGHRRTYIGSMPGRVINALISAKSNNPVILLDEIDKLGNDYKGDPSSALLELLDAEQNNKFVDHFVELPFDLSNVVFIATANYYDNIPQPLLDRMEIIQLTSYTREEKRNIAKLHLIPTQLKKHGLKKAQLQIRDDAVNLLCDQYTREAGVRGLEREIAALCRKTALGIADGKFERLTVNARRCEELLG
ncbi:MAG: endopeptidase La, partial [Clostridia bacterium]|nr:endopeptidase La [Clostridia bacterium]